MKRPYNIGTESWSPVRNYNRKNRSGTYFLIFSDLSLTIFLNWLGNVAHGKKTKKNPLFLIYGTIFSVQHLSILFRVNFHSGYELKRVQMFCVQEKKSHKKYLLPNPCSSRRPPPRRWTSLPPTPTRPSASHRRSWARSESANACDSVWTIHNTSTDIYASLLLYSSCINVIK